MSFPLSFPPFLLRGIRNNCIILVICLLVGFFYGLILLTWKDHWGDTWPTSEMSGRGMWKSLWYGCLQAICGGGGMNECFLTASFVVVFLQLTTCFSCYVICKLSEWDF